MVQSAGTEAVQVPARLTTVLSAARAAIGTARVIERRSRVCFIELRSRDRRTEWLTHRVGRRDIIIIINY